MSLRVVTAPWAEPVTVDRLREQARISSLEEQQLLQTYITAAREMAEHELQRTLVATTYELVLDAFPAGTIELPMGPLNGELTVSSVKYTDPAGVEQTVDPSAYTVDPYAVAPRLEPVSGWPSPKVTPNAVRIRYVSGSATPDSVPHSVKTWVLLHAAHFSENREAVASANLIALPHLARLLDPYRSFR